MIQSNVKSTDQIASKLITYLRDKLDDPTITYDSPLTQVRGGNETAVYQFQLNGAQTGLNQRLILRLYPEYHAAEDAVWESGVQNVLANAGYPVARAYMVCTDKSILGGAFFIMEFLSGESMWTAPIEIVPEMLGKTHAALHKLDPEPLIKLLNEQGFDENRYTFRKDFFGALANAVREAELPWARDILDWLIKNRPPEPERLAICHGDFHPLNILIQDGKVTGVLDWHLFIADPVLDVANTIKLITVYYKHLSGPASESIDWEMLSQQYLDAYRTQLPLNITNMDYYRVVQYLVALYDGLVMQTLRHPLIVKDLIEFIHKVTGIRITNGNNVGSRSSTQPT